MNDRHILKLLNEMIMATSVKNKNWVKNVLINAATVIEEQQKEIERLKTIEQAYQAMKKAL